MVKDKKEKNWKTKGNDFQTGQQIIQGLFSQNIDNITGYYEADQGKTSTVIQWM